MFSKQPPGGVVRNVSVKLLVRSPADIRQGQKLHRRGLGRIVGFHFSRAAPLGTATAELALAPAEGLDELPENIGGTTADDQQDREVLGEGCHVQFPSVSAPLCGGEPRQSRGLMDHSFVSKSAIFNAAAGLASGEITSDSSATRCDA